MINDLIKNLSQHIKEAGIVIDVEKIRVSKFYHGRANENSSVLFLFSHDRLPIAIGKVTRQPDNNEHLKFESEAMRTAKGMQSIFYIPKVFGLSELPNGHLVLFEEVIEGHLVGQREAIQYIQEVVDFVRSCPCKGVWDSNAFIEKAGSYKDAAKSYETALANVIRISTSANLHLSSSHGDLTYRNVIVGGSTPTLIDWERWGERPLWGIDLAHYLLRMSDSQQPGERVIKALAIWSDDMLPGMTASDFECLCWIDIMFDILQKFDREKYQSLSQTCVPASPVL